MTYYLTLLSICYKGILAGMAVGSVLTCAAGAGLYKLYLDHCGSHPSSSNDNEIGLQGDTHEDA